MSQFIVSARKYRPTTFEEVVGQEQVTQTLSNAIHANKIAQAYLFCGPRGVGKTTCARIFAREINKGHLAEDSDLSFNVFELDAASNNKVEHMHALTDQVRIPPQTGKYKVYIIDEVHMLSQSAFNAFLKTLEEPPPYAIFILATTEKHKILPTILSRCQIYDFKRIGVNDIIPHLRNICQKEGIDFEEEALPIIAQKADGALRDALSIFDRLVSFNTEGGLTYQGVLDSLNILDFAYYFKVTDAILQQDTPALMQYFDEILHQGFEGDTFINGLAQHFRDVLMCKQAETVHLLEVGDKMQEKYLQQAGYTPTSLLLNGLSILHKASLQYGMALNKRLHVEMALLRVCYLQQAVEGEPLPEGQAAKKKSKPVAKKTVTPAPTTPANNPAPPPPPAEETEQEPPGTAVEEPAMAEKNKQETDEDTPTEATPAAQPKKQKAKASRWFADLEEEAASLPAEQEPALMAEEDLPELTAEDAKKAQHILLEHLSPTKDSTLYPIIKQYPPAIRGHQLILTVSNKLELELLHQHRNRLTDYLYPEMPKGFMLVFEIDPGRQQASAPERPLTTDEKLQKAKEKNKAVDSLINQLKLDPDY